MMFTPGCCNCGTTPTRPCTATLQFNCCFASLSGGPYTVPYSWSATVGGQSFEGSGSYTYTGPGESSGGSAAVIPFAFVIPNFTFTDAVAYGTARIDFPALIGFGVGHTTWQFCIRCVAGRPSPGAYVIYVDDQNSCGLDLGGYTPAENNCPTGYPNPYGPYTPSGSSGSSLTDQSGAAMMTSSGAQMNTTS